MKMWSGDSTSFGSNNVPLSHCRSTPSLIGTPASTDGTTCSILLSESSMPDMTDTSDPQSPIPKKAPWTSATAIFERGENTTTEIDGYVTAHTSMVSIAQNDGDAEIHGAPKDFGVDVFITMGSPVPLLDDNSPSQSIQSGDVCRICHGEHSNEAPLISPCNCSGSMKYVHQECIQTWLKSSHSLSCELCRFAYLTGTKMKPLREWKPLELTLLERWKIVCCVMIQLFAICYFVLSVEALVRAARDFHVPQAAVWLWIKIIMSVFGISVSVACTLRQCKTFVRLFRRWEMYNKTVFVKDRGNSLNGGPANMVLRPK